MFVNPHRLNAPSRTGIFFRVNTADLTTHLSPMNADIRNTIRQHVLLNEKQKKPFVCLNNESSKALHTSQT